MPVTLQEVRRRRKRKVFPDAEKIPNLLQRKFGAGTHEQARCTSAGSTVRYRLIYGR
jgi:hypothetical protein